MIWTLAPILILPQPWLTPNVGLTPNMLYSSCSILRKIPHKLTPYTHESDTESPHRAGNRNQKRDSEPKGKSCEWGNPKGTISEIKPTLDGESWREFPTFSGIQPMGNDRSGEELSRCAAGGMGRTELMCCRWDGELSRCAAGGVGRTEKMCYRWSGKS